MADNKSDCTPIKLSDEEIRHCGNRGYKMDCRGRRLQGVPYMFPPASEFPGQPLCVLDLSNNNFVNLRANAFNSSNINASQIQMLYLQLNKISTINDNAFVGLSNLKYLNLSANCLSWPRHNTSFYSLTKLTSLETINLKCNNFSTFEGLDTVLQELAYLKNLYITPTCQKVKYSFGYGFKNMSLITLDVSKSEMCSCYLSQINNETFSNLTVLEQLFFSGCHVRNITPGALQPLNKTLKRLDMSRNQKLTFKGMNNALQGLKGSTTLQNLHVNYLHSLFDRSVELTKNDMRYISTMKNLTNLYMDLNKIDVVSAEVLSDSMIPPTLQTITLAGNRLNYGKYMKYLGNPENLTCIDISRQFIGYDPFQSEEPELASHFSYGDNSYTADLGNRSTAHEDNRAHPVWNFVIKEGLKHESANVSIRQNDWTALFTVYPGFQVNCTCDSDTIEYMICLPKQLKTFIWSESHLYVREKIQPSLMCGAFNLETLDLSQNVLTNWEGPVLGLTNLKNLTLVGNFCTYISKHFFLGASNLEYLNISRNILGDVFKIGNPNASLIFSNQRKMKKLYMQQCEIFELHSSLFESMSMLEELHLDNNYLKSFNMTLTSECFHTLMLGGNKLAYIPNELMHYLDKMNKSECVIKLQKSVVIDLVLQPTRMFM